MRMEPDGRLINDTGTGNTLQLRRARVVRASWWSPACAIVRAGRCDGRFRFDLAPHPRAGAGL